MLKAHSSSQKKTIQQYRSLFPGVTEIIAAETCSLSKKNKDVKIYLKDLQRDDVEIIIDKFQIDLTAVKLKCLKPNEWLNDEVINFYMSMLDERDSFFLSHSEQRRSIFFSSFFMFRLAGNLGNEFVFDNVKRWTKNTKKVFDLDKIFIPINIMNAHWTMCVVYVQSKTIFYFDPLFRDQNFFLYVNIVLKWLQSVAKEEKALTFNADDWKRYVNPPNMPKQTDGSSCGVFAIKFADFLSQRLPIDSAFSNKDMGNFRIKIGIAIRKGTLLSADEYEDFKTRTVDNSILDLVMNKRDVTVVMSVDDIAKAVSFQEKVKKKVIDLSTNDETIDLVSDDEPVDLTSDDEEDEKVKMDVEESKELLNTEPASTAPISSSDGLLGSPVEFLAEHIYDKQLSQPWHDKAKHAAIRADVAAAILAHYPTFRSEQSNAVGLKVLSKHLVVEKAFYNVAADIHEHQDCSNIKERGRKLLELPADHVAYIYLIKQGMISKKNVKANSTQDENQNQSDDGEIVDLPGDDSQPFDDLNDFNKPVEMVDAFDQLMMETVGEVEKTDVVVEKAVVVDNAAVEIVEEADVEMEEKEDVVEEEADVEMEEKEDVVVDNAAVEIVEEADVEMEEKEDVVVDNAAVETVEEADVEMEEAAVEMEEEKAVGAAVDDDDDDDDSVARAFFGPDAKKKGKGKGKGVASKRKGVASKGKGVASKGKAVASKSKPKKGK